MVPKLTKVYQFTKKKKRVLVIAVKAHHLSFVQGHGLEQLKVYCSKMFREVKNKV